MRQKHFCRFVMSLLIMLCGMSAFADNNPVIDTSKLSQYDQNAPIGWATVGGNVTGSNGANPVTVTTLDELTEALDGTTATTIYVCGTIEFTGSVNIKNAANKTVIGLPGATLQNSTHSDDKTQTGILTLSNCSNIIIRNLTFKAAGAYDIDGNDNLTLTACDYIWIDHCDFQDGVDGNLDCNNGSNHICVSWCRFRYLISPWPEGSGGSDDHRFSNLWGGGDGNAAKDEGKLNTTFYACWWDDGCKQRMPRVRFGKVHILNCLYSTNVSSAICIGAGYRSNIYAENNVFSGTFTPWQNYATASGYTDYNIKLVGNSGAADTELSSGSITQFVPSYTYTAMATNAVEAAVTASNGAGATLTMKTVYSWNQGTETGGAAVASGADDSSSDINNSYIRLKGKNDFSTNVITVTFNQAIHAGDIIRVTAYRNKDTSGKTSGFKAKFEKGTSTVASSTGMEFVNINQAVAGTDEYGTEANTCTFIVPDDADGSTTMTMTRSHTGTNLYVTKLEITTTSGGEEPQAQSFTTVYDLAASMYAATSNFEGTTGTLAPTTAEEAANAPELQVDATNGKLGKNNTDWAQIRANTVLTLPGVPEGAKITFVLYNTTPLEINGVTYTNGQTYTTTANENVTMTCKADGYIKSITVVGAPFVTIPAEEPTEGYTNTWQFGKENGAPEFALQKSAEYVYEVNGYALIINTDAGKLNNASRTDKWAQCNNGTSFKVPTYEGAKLTWGKYSGGNTTGFTIDSKLYNDYYIADAEGTTNMVAQGINYLSHISIEPVSLYEISGTITGGDINDTPILFTATGNGQTYTATVTGNTFTLKVPADTYTLSLSDNVPYIIGSPENVTVSAAGNIGTVTIAAAQPQTVSGYITNAPAEAFTLTFTGASHTETVDCAANATSYNTTLSPDTYVISSSVGALSPLSVESFKVVKDAATHNIYYPEAAVPAATQQNITVDKTLNAVTANNYRTINDAIAAIKAGGITAPVITLTSGQTYREQVIIDLADVTMKTSGTEKATITFYYGIGYTYYSLNNSGYYDKDRAMTRNGILKKSPDRWGATVKVNRYGKNFKAENIIFENSFNQYYTEEEVIDGVQPNGIESITYDRTLAPGATGYKAADSRAVTERAAAIVFENDPKGCELHNCVFNGSQDTFNTGSGNTLYVKDCDIIGNTDYIFGGGNVVFDNCNLVIGGYSDQETTAYITANSPIEGEYYIFRDCTVKAYGRQYTAANLGRDWGGAKASVCYFNLKNELGNKMSYKWSDMGGGVNAGTANLHIYDFDPTVNANYSTSGTTGANVNGLVSDEDALDLYANVVTRLGFTPEHIYDDDVVLDEGSYYNVCRIAATDNVERNVNLTRTIPADRWNTIVLPFDLTADQITATFGEGTKVAQLADGDAEDIKFTTVTAMTANQPYAIKVPVAITVNTPKTLSGVTVKSDTPMQTVGGWQFTGTYTKGNIPNDSYFFSSNKLYKAVDDTNTVKAFRAWFTYNGVSAARELSFSIDDETTSIKVNEKDNKNDNLYYTVDGRRLNSQPSTKGIYITNGRKVVIK